MYLKIDTALHNNIALLLHKQQSVDKGLLNAILRMLINYWRFTTSGDLVALDSNAILSKTRIEYDVLAGNKGQLTRNDCYKLELGLGLSSQLNSLTGTLSRKYSTLQLVSGLDPSSYRGFILEMTQCVLSSSIDR